MSMLDDSVWATQLEMYLHNKIGPALVTGT